MKNRKYLCVLLAGMCFLAGCDGKTAQTDASRLKEQSTQQEEAVSESLPATEGIIEMPETEAEPAPMEQTITLSATGDCTLGVTQTQGYAGSFHEYYDNYGEEYFFRGVRDIFEEDDFTLVNLECVLTTSDNRIEKTFNLKGKPEYAGIMTGSSVEGCSLGNNHSQDYGWESLVDTQNVLDEAGIIYGFNDHVGIFTTQEGLAIGIVSASLLSQSEQSENYIRDGIAELKAQGADLVVACCHWGIEKDYYPSGYQKTTAHKIIDWGADLVVGNHPHVLQGVEYYNNKIICYSLGNFCFGGNKNPSDKNTMIFQQTFYYKDGQLQPVTDAKIIPCTLSSVSSHNDFQPTVAQGDKKTEIIQKMNDYSAPFGEVSFDEEGILHLED